MAHGFQDYTGFDTPVDVPSGGTGAGSFTLNGVLYGRSGNPLGVTAAGAAGQVLAVPLAGGAPAFQGTDGARVYRSTDQILSDNVELPVVFDAEIYDYGSLWDGVGFPARLTIQKDGVYAVAGHAIFDLNVTGLRILRVRKNGLVYIAEQRALPVLTLQTVLAVATLYRFNSGDHVDLMAYQNSGGNLNLIAYADEGQQLAVQWLRP